MSALMFVLSVLDEVDPNQFSKLCQKISKKPKKVVPPRFLKNSLNSPKKPASINHLEQQEQDRKVAKSVIDGLTYSAVAKKNEVQTLTRSYSEVDLQHLEKKPDFTPTQELAENIMLSSNAKNDQLEKSSSSSSELDLQDLERKRRIFRAKQKFRENTLFHQMRRQMSTKLVNQPSSIESSGHSSSYSKISSLEDVELECEVAADTVPKSTPTRDAQKKEVRTRVTVLRQFQHKGAKKDELKIIYEGRNILNLESNLRPFAWQTMCPLNSRDEPLNLFLNDTPYEPCPYQLCNFGA